MLLSLLDNEPLGVPDFYVQYHTVQALTALAAVSSYRVQEASHSLPQLWHMGSLLKVVHSLLQQQELSSSSHGVIITA